MAKIINQEFGNNWAFYNADCIFGMSNLPGNCVDFSVYSPPFAKLYIYSDSVADMGNSSDDGSFYEGYEFALKELCRVTKEGGYQAIHCKDLMRYMSSHGYSGQDDFPGKIIRLAESCGWAFQRWITIWKNPVVEMQRTKTYGLLHKSFQERAEVVRQGAPDIVLILRKQSDSGEFDAFRPMPILPEAVKKRIRHIWSNENESEAKYLQILSRRLGHYTAKEIDSLSSKTEPGRLCFVHCIPIPRFFNGEIVGYFDMMGEIISRFEAQGSWKFHTRIALADGSYLVGFRNWTDELKRNYKELNGQVTHSLTTPKNALKHTFSVTKIKNEFHGLKELASLAFGTRTEKEETIKEMVSQDAFETITRTEFQASSEIIHPHYVGNSPPRNWHDESYYSILVWQKYASPVWYDLDGLPESHPDSWMDIDQTDVLNFKAAKDPEDQKHICPLQLGLIERLILEHTEPGDVVSSSFAGISSEGYQAIKLGRKAILFELKPSYWQQGVKYLKEVEKQSQQMAMGL